jgi:glutaminyl-peptide cyclotransferase
MALKGLVVISLFLTISLLTVFCNHPVTIGNKNQSQDTIALKKENQTELLFETIPIGQTNYKIGEMPSVKVSQKDSFIFDSIQFFFNKKKMISTIKLPVELKLQDKIEKVGTYDIEATIFKKGSSNIQKFPIILLSDIEPQKYSYEIIKVYPHDRKAYTQGLIFNDGFFYEATGLKGESTLRKVQVSSGDPIQTLTIDPNVFGEGITLFNDKIIQLSWQNNIGFVYDKKTFQQLGQFNYPTEGWGITNDGTNLIMSDGTNKLYFLETQSYSETSHIEVFDNKGPVPELNELEFING